MARLKNWPSRLAALVEAARLEPFAWGRHDCCLWGADSVLACTGLDPAAKWRGTYSDAAGAAALLQQLGGIAAVAAMAGPEILPRLAGAGDVGLIDFDGRETLAVHSGVWWLAVSGTGLSHWSVDSAVRAWKVGADHV